MHTLASRCDFSTSALNNWIFPGTAQVEVMACSQGVTYPLKAFLGHRVKKYALLNMDKTDKQAVMG